MKKYRLRLPFRTHWARISARLQRYSILILFTILIVLLFISPPSWPERIQIALVTVVGTIIGAIASYMGSTRIQREQAKSAVVINRKNKIYVPLYNELTKNAQLLKYQPYPHRIVFDIRERRINPLPEILTWKSIQNDERKFQVPLWLEEALSEYEELAVSYMKSYEEASDDLEKRIKKAHQDTFGLEIRINDIMYLITPAIISQNTLIPQVAERSLESAQGQDNTIIKKGLSELQSRIITENQQSDLIKKVQNDHENMQRATEQIRVHIRKAIDVIIQRFETIDEIY